eukprot:4093320-Pleurochrysis_carterae.AAC.2
MVTLLSLQPSRQIRVGHLPPQEGSLVVAVQEADGSRELVGLAVADGLAAGGEQGRVEQRHADGPHRDESVGPVASALVLTRGALERVVVVQVGAVDSREVVIGRAVIEDKGVAQEGLAHALAETVSF